MTPDTNGDKSRPRRGGREKIANSCSRSGVPRAQARDRNVGVRRTPDRGSRAKATGTAMTAARRRPRAETSIVTRAPHNSSGRLSITMRTSKPLIEDGRRLSLHQRRDVRQVHREAKPLPLELGERAGLLQLEH